MKPRVTKINKIPLLKVCFHMNVNDSQRMRIGMSKNGKVQHSYFGLQQFAKHALGFVNCLRESFLVRREFLKVWNFLRTFPAFREQLMTLLNPRTCLANFWSVKYECWTLEIFSTFASFANRLCAPWKHYFRRLSRLCATEFLQNAEDRAL